MASRMSNNRCSIGRLGLAVLALSAGAAFADVPPPDYDFQWANIGDRNNPAYPGGPPVDGNKGRGSVDYAYRISKLEITTAQWADFANMALRQGVNLDQFSLRPSFWGATPSGNQYIATSPMRPCIGLTWRAGAYYCNWLTNGKQESWQSCLSGAYNAATFGGAAGSPYTDQLAHSPGAKFWIPTLDEYLKASHYDPSKSGPGQGGWWDYPYQSDSPPIPGAPGVGQTSAGWKPGNFGELLVPLGAYPNSKSAYGLWDLSGASAEWVEDPVTFDSASGHYINRRVFGSYAGSGSFPDDDFVQSGDAGSPADDAFYGFRIASQIPSPSVVTVIFVGIAGLFSHRRRSHS